MNRQRGQAAIEFALMSPIIFLLIFASIYGGAMFIQFLNFNNEARTIARTVAVADSSTSETKTVSDRDELIAYYNSIGEKEFGIYYVKLTVWTTPATSPVDVVVRYDFNRTEFPFNFPPAHFATSYTMKLEN